MATTIGDIDDDDDFDEAHDINVTPFIDVMLVLLIIFMIAAPLSTVDLPVDLPSSTAVPQKSPTNLLTSRSSPIFRSLSARRRSSALISRTHLIPCRKKARTGESSCAPTEGSLHFAPRSPLATPKSRALAPQPDSSRALDRSEDARSEAGARRRHRLDVGSACTPQRVGRPGFGIFGGFTVQVGGVPSSLALSGAAATTTAPQARPCLVTSPPILLAGDPGFKSTPYLCQPHWSSTNAAR
jgi:hypothetical protein